MILYKDICIDMDGTLINWSKGNVRKALMAIEDPDYYKTLEPMAPDLPDILAQLKQQGHRLHIISAVPDYNHCAYVPIKGYQDYYNKVVLHKRCTILKYFRGLFDTVNFTAQSDSKALYLKDKNLENPLLFDDMDKYLDEWKKEINPYAIKISEEAPLRESLLELMQIEGLVIAYGNTRSKI